MILPDYVLCYIPRAMAILGKKWKFWNLLVTRGGGPFDVSSGPFVVLEILEKILNLGTFFQNFENFQNFELKFPKSEANFELKFPKSEANFDAERGIYT